MTRKKPPPTAEQSIAHDVARSIVEAIREAIFLTDLDGSIEAVNPAATVPTGTGMGDMIGARIFDVLPEVVESEVWRANVETLRREPDRKAIELAPVHLETADGEVHSLSPTMSLVESTAGDATGVIVTLRDVTVLRRHQMNLRALTERLIKTEEQERRRIARYVHDMIIQNLSLSRIKLSPLRQRLAEEGRDDDAALVRVVKQLVDETIEQCRSVMTDLSPPLLYEVGLVAALEELADRLASRHDIPIRIVDDDMPPEMPNPTRGLLFQCARELIWNALKHAGPCEIKVALSGDSAQYRIVVEDNGRGFDLAIVDEHTASGTSFGLFNVRERLEGLGGHLDIHTRPGDGTVATIILPRRDAPEEE